MEEEEGEGGRDREGERGREEKDDDEVLQFSNKILSHWWFPVCYLEVKFGAILPYDVKYGMKRSRHDPGAL